MHTWWCLHSVGLSPKLIPDIWVRLLPRPFSQDLLTCLVSNWERIWAILYVWRIPPHNSADGSLGLPFQGVWVNLNRTTGWYSVDAVRASFSSKHLLTVFSSLNLNIVYLLLFIYLTCLLSNFFLKHLLLGFSRHLFQLITFQTPVSISTSSRPKVREIRQYFIVYLIKLYINVLKSTFRAQYFYFPLSGLLICLLACRPQWLTPLAFHLYTYLTVQALKKRWHSFSFLPLFLVMSSLIT